jgi:hypothetical protein
MAQKVYILRCDWIICGDSGHDNIAVYSNKESACKALQSYVENEKATSLNNFFSNGELIANKTYIDDYEVREDYFLFTTKCGEWILEVSIEEFDLN